MTPGANRRDRLARSRRPNTLVHEMLGSLLDADGSVSRNEGHRAARLIAGHAGVDYGYARRTVAHLGGLID